MPFTIAERIVARKREDVNRALITIAREACDPHASGADVAAAVYSALLMVGIDVDAESELSNG